MEIRKKLQADFFKTENGNEPVRNFLKVLSSEDKKSVGVDIMAIEMSWPVRLSESKKNGYGFMGIKNIYFRQENLQNFFYSKRKKDGFTSCNN